ncbi:proton-coupled folate transporter [Exaiptasia diaphana]|uniref:Major facilitator superfamily (MFS) profile domain-containing protein n=1 Tax=Exaiptasia diaphana TaxID=2652724 RepID=A0A913YI09_EXADI|nr:proton-coupled folate transporter [Exaiptasia diaphana]KXJ14646.1 Proton-coupled folate transporter [Exaiptasia diaphana]
MKISRLTWKSFIYIEPVLLLYSCGFFMSLPVQKQFIYSRYSEEVGFPYSLDSKGKGSCSNVNDAAQNETLKLLETKVQELASGFDRLVIPCTFLPATVMGLFIGPWTDSVGRKPALLISTFGAVLESLIVIGVMYFRWSLHLLIVGKLLNALSGFFTLLGQASFNYVIDMTDKSLLSTRLAALQLVIFIGGFLGQTFSGVLMSSFGFILPYVGMSFCFISSFTYCLLVVPESRQTSSKQDTSLFNVHSLKRVINVFTSPRPSHQKRNLIILIAIDSLFFSLTKGGVMNIVVLYLIKSPLCFSSTGLGAFFGFKFASEGLVGIAGVIVLRKVLCEENVFRAGFVSTGLAFFWLAYVQTQNMVFLVPIISSISGIVMPLVKGAISTLVKQEEQGATNTAVGVLESLALVVGSWIFNTLYIIASEAKCTYMVFVVLGAVSLTPIFMISALQKLKEE